MSIGGGIFLIVVGAILTFALNVQTSWVNLDIVGWICMAAGLIILILGIVALFRRRSSIVTTRTVDGTGDRVQSTERHDDVS
jgi:hypothetical protein